MNKIKPFLLRNFSGITFLLLFIVSLAFIIKNPENGIYGYVFTATTCFFASVFSFATKKKFKKIYTAGDWEVFDDKIPQLIIPESEHNMGKKLFVTMYNEDFPCKIYDGEVIIYRNSNTLTPNYKNLTVIIESRN